MKNNKLNWINVDTDNSELNSEGLISIEECTDYNLLNCERPISQLHRYKRKIKKGGLQHCKKKQKLESKDITVSEVLSPSKYGCSVEGQIEIHQNIDGTDLSCWNNFGLTDSIIKALEKQGFKEPTQIQLLTLPAAILGRRDIIGAAETGSGKTLAFGLPILAGILNEKEKLSNVKENTVCKRLYALILTPTRELAIQIKNHLVMAAEFTGINIAVVVGGMAAAKQERILSKGPEIVVATPGRLWELIQQGNTHLSQIGDIRFLVIDETDRMLERGHFEELYDLLERINQDEHKRRKRQNFVFSATLTLVHDLPKHLMMKMKTSKLRKMTPEQKLQKIINILGITNSKIVDITQGNGTSKTLTESRITCNIEEKDYYVYYFLQKYPGRTLIFCNSIGCVRRLTNLLNILGCSPLPLHASMQQRQRLKNLDKFKDDNKGILVATDVAARGLDIPKVEHVLHYQTPRTCESYVHRSGRTARASHQGLTLLLMEPSEMPNYIKLCKTLNKEQDLPVFPLEENYLNAIKERVNLARELDKLELEIRKRNSESGWLQKAAEEMDIVIDEFIPKYDANDSVSKKKLAGIKRKQLMSLLAKPVFPKGFSGKYFLGSDVPLPLFLSKENDKTAVEVVKDLMENTEKNYIPLYKPSNKKRQK